MLRKWSRSCDREPLANLHFGGGQNDLGVFASCDTEPPGPRNLHSGEAECLGSDPGVVIGNRLTPESFTLGRKNA